VSGVEGDIVAHHVRCLGGGGMGLKPSDLMCVPLTPIEHERLHRIGEKTFWAEHSIDPKDELAKNMLIFLARYPVTYEELAFYVDSFLRGNCSLD
jgi:hypothetical protein